MERVMAISRRAFMRVLGGTAVFAAATGAGLATCDTMPAAAVEGWNGAAAAETEPRRRALSYALLAPNSHNLQPWIADLREAGAITLWTDPARLLPMTDPVYRQITVSGGCFLELLVLALGAEGIAADVTLFPDGGRADAEVGAKPFARVVLSDGGTKDALFDQILKRRSAKDAYDAARPASAEALAAIAAAAAGPGMIWAASRAEQVQPLRDLARRGWHVEVDTDRTFSESVEKMRIGAEAIAATRDGLSMHGPFFWWARVLGIMTPEAQMAPGSMARAQARDFMDAAIDGTPGFLWQISQANDRAAQVDAGRAYVRANLKATELGLGMAPLSQLIQEFPEMAALQAEFYRLIGVPAGHTVQMFVRLGYGATPAPSPRRRLDDILKD
jgi:nitroreductase